MASFLAFSGNPVSCFTNQVNVVHAVVWLNCTANNRQILQNSVYAYGRSVAGLIYLTTVEAQNDRSALSSSDDGGFNLCYACTYMQLVFADNEELIGHEDCLRPTAASSEIPRVECYGYCAVSVSSLIGVIIRLSVFYLKCAPFGDN